MRKLFFSIALAFSSAIAQTAWVPLSGTTFSSSMCPANGASNSVCPDGTAYPYTSGACVGGGNNTNCTGTLNSWSGGVARKKAGSEEMWLLNNGGHGDYGGNESYMLNLHVGTPTFTRIGNPSQILNTYFNNSVRSYPDGKPSSRHTYDQVTYLPWLDKFFLWNGSAYGSNGTSYRDGWLYDPNIDASVSNPWTEVVPSTAGGCINPQTGGYSGAPGGAAVANPNDNMIYVMYAAGWMFKLNPATSCYTSLGQAWPTTGGLAQTPYGYGDGSNAIIDVTRNRIVLVGDHKVQTLSLTGTVVDVTPSVGASCAMAYNSYGPGLFHDTVNDLYVAYPLAGGDTLYFINPTTWACTTQTTTGGPTSSATQGMWGRFDYFPTLGKIVVMTQGGQGWRTLAYSAPVNTPPTITTTTLPAGTNGTAYSQTLSATGVPSTFTWSITVGSLPIGLTLNTSTGAITGTPTVTAVSSFTVKASNGVAPDATQALSITISAANVAPTISTTSLPGGTVGTSYSQILAATGTPSTFSWTVTAGSLPTGLSINSSTGVISGTPAVAGTASFTVTCANGVAPNATQVLSIVVSSAPTGTTNSLTIKNEGSSTTNYPVQIGRAFVQGEIPNGSLPQVSIDGIPVSTQVDVKNRWSDASQSLKYAIISFIIPTFTSGQTYNIAFVSGTTVGNTALTKAQMLSAGFDFDAVISLTNGGTTRTASARTMLSNDDYTVWASGPIATTIILGNHAQGFACTTGVASGAGTVASKYDFGMNTHCAFRPIFEATFWAATNQVYVRYIGEISNTEQLEDVVVSSMFLTRGSASPNQWYTRNTSFTMYAASRWTKTTWIGGTPPVADINHNLAYLKGTYAVPNYDTSKVISGSTISANYTTWQGVSKNLYDAGEWQKVMGAVGGRPDIGPYPSWIVRWLYTGDYRAQEEAIGNAELAASWPMNLREGKTGKFLDRAGTVSGLGRIVSTSSRKTLSFLSGGSTQYDYSSTAAGDAIVPVGTVTTGGWTPDAAHQPNTWTLPYTLTGDYFYLEQSLFWASWTQSAPNGANTVNSQGRGPDGGYGGMPGYQSLQTRGQAWGFRGRVEAAWITPDSMPEKAWLTGLANDAIAIWEGQRNVTGTANQGGTLWTWGNNSQRQPWFFYFSMGIPPLHHWDAADSSFTQYPSDPTVTEISTSTWEQNFVIYALGRAKELGFPTTALLNWVGSNLISQAVDPTYNPWLLGAYRLPMTSLSTHAYFTDWAGVKSGFVSAAQTGTSFAPMYVSGDCTGNASDCYAYFASAAISMVADQTNGAAAWAWALANIESLSATQNEPKWAILPRSTTPVTPPATGVGVSLTGGIRGSIK